MLLRRDSTLGISVAAEIKEPQAARDATIATEQLADLPISQAPQASPDVVTSTDPQLLDRTKTLLDFATKQLISFRDTGYKLIITHAATNLAFCSVLTNETIKSSLKPFANSIFLFIVAFWFIFFWWQVSLYLHGGRMNVVTEQCIAILAKTDVRIPSKSRLARRSMPAVLMPVFITIATLKWSAIAFGK